MISRISRRRPTKRCNQCWKVKPREDFIGVDGRERAKNCNACRTKYGRWNKLTAAEKLATRGPRKDPAPTGRVVFVVASKNRKLGPIPVSYSERGTCPQSCMFYEAGCYAENGKDGAHWRGVARRGLTWDEFLFRVRDLPEGTLWRHNEAGDLRGTELAIDVDRLIELVAANRGRRGFTFTHRTAFASCADQTRVLLEANTSGFVVNLSADSLAQADELAALACAPVVVTVPVGEQLPARSAGGRKLVPCPAQTHARTCAECQLCARPHRKSIVVFRAHGQSAALVPELVRRKRAAIAEAS